MESSLYQPIPEGLEIIETLRFEPERGWIRIQLHLDRLERTCECLKISFRRNRCRSLLDQIDEKQFLRGRITVYPDGLIKLNTTAFKRITPLRPWRLSLSSVHLDETNPWLGVKTNQRALYDQTLADLPDDTEMIFLNRWNQVCEGSRTNLFVKLGGEMLTPSYECGLLPGVLRQELLLKDRVSEAILKTADVKNAEMILIGNSLRGLIPAELDRSWWSGKVDESF